MEMEVDLPAATGGAHGAPPPCFDCSICLEPARQPVVTPCGNLYCHVCVRRWLRSSGHPGADHRRHCPVCKAAVSEGRLLPLYGRGAPSFRAADPTSQNAAGGGGHGVDEHNERLRLGVEHTGDINNHLHGQHYGSHWGSVLHSSAGCLIGSAAAAVLPWAFPGGRLSPVPPRPVIVGDGRRWQCRVQQSLHQIWLFLAVSALLCFLLF